MPKILMIFVSLLLSQASFLNCISLCCKTAGSTQKPEDMYRIIEHFALGRRRLELFGEDHNIRAGWLTVGKGLSSSNFESQVKSHIHAADIYLPPPVYMSFRLYKELL